MHGSDAPIAFGLSRPDDGHRDPTLAVRSSPGHYTSLDYFVDQWKSNAATVGDQAGRGQLETFEGDAKISGKQSPAGGREPPTERVVSMRSMPLDLSAAVAAKSP